jgi:hypothetical protein
MRFPAAPNPAVSEQPQGPMGPSPWPRMRRIAMWPGMICLLDEHPSWVPPRPIDVDFPGLALKEFVGVVGSFEEILHDVSRQ